MTPSESGHVSPSNDELSKLEPRKPPPQPLESTIDLLRRYREGDNRALDKLLKRNLSPLLRWASGRLPLRARSLLDTEDLVQDTITRALPHLAKIEYRGEGAIQAYLRQAVSNRIKNEYRRVSREPQVLPAGTELVDYGPTPLDELIGRETVEIYDRALASLRDTDRELVILRIDFGVAYQQIAAATGKPSEDAARVATARAILKLAQAMRAIKGGSSFDVQPS